MSDDIKIQYESIQNQDSDYVCKDGNGDINGMEYIKGLSQVNLFIGANNSGKSRFLRNLFFTDSRAPQTFKWKIIGEDNKVNNILKILELQPHPHDLYYGIKSENNPRLLQIYEECLSNVTKGHETIFYFPILRGFQHFEAHHLLNPTKNFRTWTEQGIFPDSLKEIGQWRYNNFFERSDIYSNYINEIYKGQIASIITTYSGQGMYNEIKEKLLGHKEERGEIKEFEQFLGNKFFEQQTIALIPRQDEGVLYVKIGETDERKIFDLGDGVQSLIILFYKMFFTENCVFLIEEPENTLHPGMQRKMIEVMYSKEIQEKNHQFFISTHSNHMMDLTLDFKNISIYKFSLLDDNRKFVEQVNSGDENVLLELGVNKSSVFIANATIWVEGVTDRMYLKKIIELCLENDERYKNLNLREDIDYAFVEYGGSNVIHFEFSDNSDNEDNKIIVNRIASKAILVADSDWEENGPEYGLKKERIAKFRETLGDERFIKIKGEIENILGPESILDGIKNFPRLSSSIDTNTNITNVEITNTAIGKLIDKKYFDGRKQFRDRTGESIKSGNKIKFAEGVVENLTYEKIPDRTKNIARKIIEFIKEQRLDS